MSTSQPATFLFHMVDCLSAEIHRTPRNLREEGSDKIRDVDFSTAITKLSIFAIFSVLYQNLNKGNPWVSGFHTHKVKTSTTIQFGLSNFWPVRFEIAFATVIILSFLSSLNILQQSVIFNKIPGILNETLYSI